MPPKPSLPIRDGRLGSSPSHIGSSQHHNEPYYSNEDIRLLHEIVTAGEEILPTLPEQDRLATNALFQAAEQVLPAHGYDPDHAPPNISRLIFKIGGLRSEGSLMDKFSSVLGGMGINLEIVDSPEQQQQQDSSSVRSSASAAVGQTGTFSVSPRYDARRRRNSESAAPTVPIEDLRNVPTTRNGRARSASFGSRDGDERLALRAPGDENIPPRQRSRLQKAQDTGVEKEDHGKHNPRLLPHRPLLVRDDETDDGFPYHRRHMDEYPVSEGEEEVDEYAPFDIFRNPIHQDYDLPAIKHTPDSYVGSSDTMAQTSVDLPSEPLLTEEDRDLMEGDIQDFQDHVARRQASTTLSKWRNEARHMAQKRQHQEAQAVIHDRRYSLGEAISLWKDNADSAKGERLSSLGPIRDHEADAEMERRVDRGYNWFILSKAFAHWYRSSEDEIERTAIARRYILRKRYFEAWRSHQVDVERKIHTFRLRNLVRIWRRAAIHREAQAHIAVQRYRHDMAKYVITTWWDVRRAEVADIVRDLNLMRSCLRAWRAATNGAIAQSHISLYEDERSLLGEAISTWAGKVQQFRMIGHRCAQQKRLVDLYTTFEEWRTLARLSKDLREFSEESSRRTKSRVIDQWLAQAGEADQKALLSRKLLLQKFVAHWRNEAKLRRLQGQNLRALKLKVVTHWRLEHKLQSYQRQYERRTKERVQAKLRAAAAEARTEAVRVCHRADIHAKRREEASTLRIWRQSMNGVLDQQDTATDRHYLFVANSCLEHWYKRAGEEAARAAELRSFAARGAYYVTTSNVLRSWAEVTKRTRKERLTKSYHSFRRRYKVNLVANCLSTWRVAMHDSHGRSYDADNVYGSYLRGELGDCVQSWRNATNMMQVMREVAQTADQEVWWGTWARRAKDLRETELDAVDYANEQRLSRCWRTWEVAILQNKGRQHVVATLQENNDKKLCRQVMLHWSHKAVHDDTYLDPRSSVASRRSVRYGNVRTADTPLFGSSANPPSSQPPAQQLPLVEENASVTYTATPRRQFGRASEPAPNPFVGGPRGMSQSLPPRPGGYFRHEGPAVATSPPNQGSISSFPVSAGLPPQQLHEDTRFPPLQAPPDFDEDDISFAPSEGNDHPTTFMSTPTPWAGRARPLSAEPARTRQAQQPPFRRPATVTAATTTPSALLDTPYERALRREYGGSGMSGVERRSAVGAGRMAATPHVTFADIREESGEGMYDDHELA